MVMEVFGGRRDAGRIRTKTTKDETERANVRLMVRQDEWAEEDEGVRVRAVHAIRTPLNTLINREEPGRRTNGEMKRHSIRSIAMSV